jgi:DNA-binding response OmpR family regulator
MRNKATILIIEDEEDIVDILEYNLQKEGFDVIGFLSTKNVKKCLKEEKVDLMIVDRNLPMVEGSEFVESLRKDGYTMPVIFLSAKVSQKDVLEGFNRGGDDYIKKPFDITELIARVKALLNRTYGKKNKKIRYRDLTLNIKNREASIDEKELELTKLEFNLLLEFVKNPNIVLTRDYLLEMIWKREFDTKEKTVNVAVKRLKDKISSLTKKKYIKTIRGEGYMLV